MADEKFKLGDVVSLRSGGPRMTIATVDGQSSFLRMVYRRPTTAKQISTNLSEETRKGMLEKAEQGIWPSFAPLGYRNLDGPDGKKIIAPDPHVAPIISKLFD
jgi:site-specific DNA recombinase